MSDKDDMVVKSATLKGITDDLAANTNLVKSLDIIARDELIQKIVTVITAHDASILTLQVKTALL
jgi:hypothetical protein